MPNANQTFDLLVTAGRLFCADTGLDGPGAVAVRGDLIVAAGAEVAGDAATRLDYPDALLLPGLVDMHAHPALGGSRYGIDPDVHFLPRGVTTCMSQGDAGALNWPAYRDEVIGGCRTRVRLALHLSKYGESQEGHCFEHLDNADVGLCVETVASAGDEIWGICFNTMYSPEISHDPAEIMSRGIEAAERSGSPILYGPRFKDDYPLEEQLPHLRPGDLFTYTFSFLEDNIIADGKVRRAVWEAKERGVLFDGCHGMRSFSFPHVETAIAEGFYPDTVSTDQYSRHVGSDPQHDLPRSMSKFLGFRHAGSRGVCSRHRAPCRAPGIAGRGGHAGGRGVRRSGDIGVERGRQVAGRTGRRTPGRLLAGRHYGEGGSAGCMRS